MPFFLSFFLFLVFLSFFLYFSPSSQRLGLIPSFLLQQHCYAWSGGGPWEQPSPPSPAPPLRERAREEEGGVGRSEKEREADWLCEPENGRAVCESKSERERERKSMMTPSIWERLHMDHQISHFSYGRTTQQIAITAHWDEDTRRKRLTESLSLLRGHIGGLTIAANQKSRRSVCAWTFPASLLLLGAREVTTPAKCRDDPGGLSDLVDDRSR